MAHRLDGILGRRFVFIFEDSSGQAPAVFTRTQKERDVRPDEDVFMHPDDFWTAYLYLTPENSRDN
ncbi:MAG: hypothetical protein KAW12_09870 [Candidatus Aminicenantes bacterium]|nr:hypothetical protein [Candidatus Aminicenantes bacterium]